jgi:hypothetical protein
MLAGHPTTTVKTDDERTRNRTAVAGAAGTSVHTQDWRLDVVNGRRTFTITLSDNQS